MAIDARLSPLVRQAGWYVLLSSLSLVVLFPVWLTIVRALSAPFVYIERGQPLYPVATDWGVFGTAWTEGNLGRAMLLTAGITTIITLAQLATSLLAAYSFAFMTYPFKRILFALIIASLLLSLIHI